MRRLSFIGPRLALAALVALLLPTLAYATGQVVSGNITMVANFAEASPSGALTSYSIPANVLAGYTYTNGTASGQVDTIYAKTLTLSGSAQTINLNSGLTDPAGNSIVFARVREFIIQNPNTTAGYDVKVEAGASNGWSVLPPSTSPIYARNNGGSIRISDPVSTGSGNGNVVTSSSCNVTLDPGANTVTLTILIVGGSAA